MQRSMKRLAGGALAISSAGLYQHYQSSSSSNQSPLFAFAGVNNHVFAEQQQTHRKVLMWGNVRALPLSSIGGFVALDESGATYGVNASRGCGAGDLTKPSLAPAVFDKHSRSIKFAKSGGGALNDSSNDLLLWGSTFSPPKVAGHEEVANDDNPIPLFMRPLVQPPAYFLAPFVFSEKVKDFAFSDDGLLILCADSGKILFCKDLTKFYESVQELQESVKQNVISHFNSTASHTKSLEELIKEALQSVHYNDLTKQHFVQVQGQSLPSIAPFGTALPEDDGQGGSIWSSLTNWAWPAKECVVEVAAGANHYLMLTNKGRVFAFGENSLGQCGLPPTRRKTSIGPNEAVCIDFTRNNSGAPVLIRRIACGANHNLFLDTFQNAFANGDDSKIQLNLGDTRSLFTTSVGDDTHKQWMDSAEKGFSASSSSQALVAYGPYDKHMQAYPIKIKEPPVPTGRPVKFPPPSEVVCCRDTSLFVHRDSPDWFSEALTTNLIFAVGDNVRGQGGRNTSRQHQCITEVPTPPRVFHKKVVCGSDHCLALIASGHVYGWGSAEKGALGYQKSMVIVPPVHVNLPGEKKLKKSDVAAFVSGAEGSVVDVFAGFKNSAMIVEGTSAEAMNKLSPIEIPVFLEKQHAIEKRAEIQHAIDSVQSRVKNSDKIPKYKHQS